MAPQQIRVDDQNRLSRAFLPKMESATGHNHNYIATSCKQCKNAILRDGSIGDFRMEEKDAFETKMRFTGNQLQVQDKSPPC
jgi:hypothetical protein